MNININDSCIACGACESMCSDVFYVEDIAKVKQDCISGNEDCAIEAAKACPVSAIEVEHS